MISFARRASLAMALCARFAAALPQEAPVALEAHEQILEETIESRKAYADPFNDVDVDVVITQGTHSWRVPAFWRGGQRWTIRFAPPSAGLYEYHWESTDSTNPDLNGREASVVVKPYLGQNALFRHGPLRVSANHRYLEHADGTPFYWLGDTWWSGLSSRLSWDGFQTLTADRRDKGFTVIQIVAGLIPGEEQAPSDPGYCNEGGCAWEANFKRINPRYFDYADRRIEHLVDNGIVPAIVGAWNEKMHEMGLERLKKHWRYVIARYGAYPVVWILGGEVVDPPVEASRAIPQSFASSKIQRGWTDLARYVRLTDAYHHPLTVHEATPPFDYPLRDESLTDFDLFQSGHWGWGSIAAEVAQIDMHYARTSVVKPLVEGEIGYEKLGGIHLEDFQRTAFWLAMLNGSAGFSYGANGVWESYTADKPLQRQRWSFLTWQEGMKLPGSYEVGLGAKLLREYPWWRFAPHPEWVSPHGTTLLEPQSEINGFDIGREVLRSNGNDDSSVKHALETEFPGGAWQARSGNFRLPYAAGVPGMVRFIYSPPQLSIDPAAAPTVIGLELGIRYHAYFWEPSTGTRIDLGTVERPAPGKRVLSHHFEGAARAWIDHGTNRAMWKRGRCLMEGDTLTTIRDRRDRDIVAAVQTQTDAPAGLVFRFQDVNNYVAAIYSPTDASLYLVVRRDGVEGDALGKTAVSELSGTLTLSAELREGKAVASISDGTGAFTTPILDIGNQFAGYTGLLHREGTRPTSYSNYELREVPKLDRDIRLERRLFDAHGSYRGELSGPVWGEFGRDTHILLDAYRPERLPTAGDWLLVLENRSRESAVVTRRSP